MKFNIYTVLFLISCTLTSFSQEPDGKRYQEYIRQIPVGQPLNAYDSIYLMSLPELPVPGQALRTELPDMVDNSIQPYFRPIFQQIGPSCGQASSIGYNFTYELNRARNLSADTIINQYPSHFTWNFMNGGNGWYGVSYFHSFEILRTCGCPNVYDYGGEYFDDGMRWISGYNVYYNGMSNRINTVYSINTGTEEGITTLKNWLHNHLENNNVGGVAGFYSCSPYNTSILNDTTPEGGKHVMTAFSPWAVHAMTIVGYHDSIRWDYNEDGQYTNHIDITGDGIIDPKDWEIGGVKVANSYGVDDLDSGFYYIMYKVLAEDFQNGGVWNRSVIVLDVKENYEPELCMKIELKHNSREKIKVLAGISADTSSFYPEHIIDFPIFNHQGGQHYMQGQDTALELQIIEFGLDVTPLLSYTESGVPARYFLIVEEDDPYGGGSGEILAYSLMDYTSGSLQEIVNNNTPVDIKENAQTLLSVVHNPDFSEVTIDTEELPAFDENVPINFQMEASGGHEPYQWSILNEYRKNEYIGEFPEDTGIMIMPVDIDTVKAVVLDFAFPFYGKLYDTLYVHKNGYIIFENEQMPWPYLLDEALFFRSIPMIAPSLNNTFVFDPGDQDGVWFSGDENAATLKWKLSMTGVYANNEYNFATRLYPDGNIEFYYGDMLATNPVQWITGISQGDKQNYLVSDSPDIQNGQVVEFLYAKFPQGLSISDGGLLSGMVTGEQQIFDITFKAKDNKDLFDTKTLQLSSGLLIEFIVADAGINNIIEYGDQVVLDASLKNISASALNNLNISISSDDPFIILADTIETCAIIAAGQSILLSDAYSFDVSYNIPDEHSLFFNIEVISDENTWFKDQQFAAFAPDLKFDLAEVQSDDEILHPGETADMLISVMNTGHASASNVTAELISGNPLITVNGNPIRNYGNLEPGQIGEQLYNVSADLNIPNGCHASFQTSIEADFNISAQDSFNLRIGKIPILIIDRVPGISSGLSLFETAGEIGIISDYVNAFPSRLEQYQSLFITLGDISENMPLNWQEGQQVADFLDNGGKVYMEGTRIWKYNPITPAQSRFNISAVNSLTFYDTIIGVEGTLFEGLKFEYDGTTIFNFYWLDPIEPAFSILTEDDEQRGCAIAYDQGTYKTIGSSVLLRDLLDAGPPSTQYDLMKKYLEFFEVDSILTDVPDIRNITSESFRLFPNPASSLIDIEFLNFNLSSTLEVYNIIGAKIYNKHIAKGTKNIQLNVSAFPVGLYLIILKSPGQITKGKKLIVSH